MTQVSGCSQISTNYQAELSDGGALASFCTKVFASGDFTSECMALAAEDSGMQMQLGRQGVKLQERAVREAREKRRELIKKIREANKDSGFWSGLTDFFSGLTTAVAAVLTVVGGPAATVGLIGAVVSGGCGLFKADYDRQAAMTQANKVQVEEFKQEAVELRDEQADSLEQAVRMEHDMTERIRELVDSSPEVVLLQDNGRSHVY